MQPFQPAYSIPVFAAGWLLGILLALHLAFWPPPEWLILALPLQYRLLRLRHSFIAACLMGACWLLVFMAWRMDLAPDRLDTQGSMQITGQVVQRNLSPGGLDSLVVRLASCQRLDGSACRLRAPGKIRLNWYPADPLPAKGETWLLEVQVRPLRSLKNFGQPPSTGVHLAQGLVARGYVADGAHYWLVHEAQGVDAWRNRTIERLQQDNELARGERFLLALGLGEQGLLLAEDWQLLERTGTVHLWIVSGLHLGMVVAAVIWLGRRLHLPWSATLLLAGLLAWGYAHLAGWGVAAERAAIMLLFGLLLLSGWRRILPWTAFSLALILLLLVNPLWVLTKGFWLSFGAVAILLAALRGLPPAPAWWNLVRVEWLLTLALTPLLIWQGVWFGLWVPLANLLAVPLVGLLLLPLTLIGLLILLGSGWSMPLQATAQLFEWAALGLDGVASLPDWRLHHPQCLWLGLLALLPPGFPGRQFAWLGLLLAFLPAAPATTAADSWQVRVLDVGQGTAVLVQSGGESLLYDTGRGFDSGWAPVVGALQPWLSPAGLQQLVVSHDDQDHSGGVQAVLQRWPVQQRWGSGARPCRAGAQWRLGHLQLLVLWPLQPPVGRISNPDSCVLLITGPGASLLLTGDAGIPQEAFFSQALPDLLDQQALTLLITGHHGSRSSTGETLLQATRPIWAVHTAGWRNPYEHPHPLVVQRLQQQGTRQFQTGEQGALVFEFTATSRQVLRWRQKHRPLWEGLVK